MGTITLSWYIKTIRKYSKNRRKSYQKILEDLFNLILKEKDAYYVESTSSSRIMNNEYDVPYIIRERFNEESLDEKKKISDEFIRRIIDQFSIDGLIFEIKEFVSASKISTQTKNEILAENDSYKVLYFALSIAMVSSNRKTLNERLYRDNNGFIDLISGDLISLGFNKKLATSEKIVVIPVDKKFTMIFKDKNGEEVINKDTIHGEWLLRMNKIGIKKPKIKYVKVNKNMRIGKCRVGKTEFYLLPISTLKERNKAKSGKKTIMGAVDDLVSEYNVSGQGVPIYLPLIGTGRSRAHLSLKDSVSLIKDAFLKNKDGFFGEVKIVVLPKNIDDLEEK